MRRVWFGLLLSALFTALLLHNVNLAGVGRELAGLDYWIFLPLTVMTLIATLLRSWRWRYLLAPVEIIGIGRLFSANSIGFMANMLFPARLGEFVRAYLVGRKNRISATAAFATIVVERLYDGFTILFILLAVVLLASLPITGEARHILLVGGWLSFALYAGIIAVLLVLRRRPDRVRALAGKFLAWAPAGLRRKVAGLMDPFQDGLGILGSPGHSLGVGISSAVIWSFNVLINYVVLLFFGLHIPVAGLFLLQVFQAFAVMLPSSPGFVGTYDAATVVGLSLLGVSKTMALSVAIVMHATLVIPTVAIGLACLWGERLSLSEVGGMSKETGGAPAV